MVYMVDAEGEPLPLDESGKKSFSIHLIDSGEDYGPDMSLGVPCYFESEGGIYNSAGVLYAPLKSALEDYLLEHDRALSGYEDKTLKFAVWLRDYAEQLIEAANRNLLEIAKLEEAK